MPSYNLHLGYHRQGQVHAVEKSYGLTFLTVLHGGYLQHDATHKDDQNFLVKDFSLDFVPQSFTLPF